jgi:CBS domain-containing protein
MTMLKLRDIMTQGVFTLTPETSLRDAVELLAEHHISGAPVLAGNRVVGVVSMADILDFQASTEPVPTERDDQVEWGAFDDEAPEWVEEDVPPGSYFTELWTDAGADIDERFRTTDSPEWDLLGEHIVSEVMDRSLHRLHPDAPVTAAADEMGRAGIHRVLVMENDTLLGIVTTMDITRMVAEHRLESKRYVFDRHQDEWGRETEY